MPLEDHKIKLVGVAGIVLGLVILTDVFFVISFATSGWARTVTTIGGSPAEVESWNVGLWEVCQCQRPAEQFPYLGESWFRATQTMVVFALLALIVASVFILMYFFFNKPSKTIMLYIITASLGAAVFFLLIAFSIFGAKMNSESMRASQMGEGTLGWSYAVSVTSGFVCLAAGVVAVIQILRSRGVC